MANEQRTDTFAALRAMLARHAGRMTVTVDRPGHYALASATLTDRRGRPLSCACVEPWWDASS